MKKKRLWAWTKPEIVFLFSGYFLPIQQNQFTQVILLAAPANGEESDALWRSKAFFTRNGTEYGWIRIGKLLRWITLVEHWNYGHGRNTEYFLALFNKDKSETSVSLDNMWFQRPWKLKLWHWWLLTILLYCISSNILQVLVTFSATYSPIL